MHRVGPADRLRTRLGEPEEADLALLHEPGHGPHGLLDGHLRVHPVLVVQVDDVDAETLQARLAGRTHILGPAADAPVRRVGASQDAELRGQEHLLPAAPDGPSDELLVRVRPVDIRRVEQVDPEIEGTVNHGDGFLFVARPVEFGHPHAAQPHGGHRGPALSQAPCLHVATPPRSQPSLTAVPLTLTMSMPFFSPRTS